MMAELYESWWEHVKHSLLIDRDAFLRASRYWKADAVYVGDYLAAIVLQNDGEIHLIKLGKHRFTKAHLATYLRYGVTTKVEVTDKASLAFVRRLGFSLHSYDADYEYFIFRKESPCLQS